MHIRAVIDRVKQYPLALVGVVGSLVFMGLIYMNSLSEPDLTAEHDRLVSVKTTLDFNALNGKNIEDDLLKLYDLKKNIASRLMDPSERAHIFHYFFQLEDESGVKIENPRQISVKEFEPTFTLPPGSQTIDLAITQYKLEATGTYPEIIHFINKLQSSHYIAKITQFDLKHSKDIAPNTLTIAMNINFFGKLD